MGPGIRMEATRLAILLQTLLLALTLQAQEETEIVIVEEFSGDSQEVGEIVVEEISDDTEGGAVFIVEEIYDDTEGEEQASGCNGPFKGRFISRK